MKSNQLEKTCKSPAENGFLFYLCCDSNISSLWLQLYGALEKLLRASQGAQIKSLQALHDRGVEDLKRRQDEYLREERKVLTKNTIDKLELERCVEWVARGTGV